MTTFRSFVLASARTQDDMELKVLRTKKIMAELSIYNQKGEETGKVRLQGDLWEGAIHAHVLHLALRQELANRRAGTHDTKTRDEVSGSGKKPWKQKGTGRARSGSVRSPLWRHGGVVFGPHPRSYRFSLPRQVRQLAFRSALRNLLADGRLAVLEEIQIPQPKTKHLAKFFSDLKENNALVLFSKMDATLARVSRNLPYVKFLSIDRLNVHDLLRFKKVFLMKESLAPLEAILGTVQGTGPEGTRPQLSKEVLK